MMPIVEQGSMRTAFAGTERRRVHRQRVLKGATLSFNKGYSAFECVVRNLSKDGAKLSLGEAFGLPATFRLAISGEDNGRIANVAWRTPTEIGVSFG